MQPGLLGVVFLAIGLIAGLLTMGAYGLSLLRPTYRKPVLAGRALYTVTALSVLGAFTTLATLVYTHNYRYEYVFQHSGNDLHSWFRFAATWAGQEGSFLLWAAWTAVIGFLVFMKAGKYEARVMPFFVSALVFLCAIMLRQTPFSLVPVPTAAQLAAHKDWVFPPPNGMGLNPSLQNYWMTIHPPTIFFGFASLLVPFCYAVAALLWRDWEDWTPRVAPYALLSCATLGLGLFMGGYWAYETQGWHGFWAWDPVENASFFPWLAVTALVHGLVVQKSRGGMARTNIFLGLLSWMLFLVGTYLTRSGILGDLSVHSFAGEGAKWMPFMYGMLALYGIGGLVLWAVRLRQIPKRKTTGDSLVSRDFAFFVAILLMLLGCVAVTLGTTQPIFQMLTHHKPSAPVASFYNKAMLPLALLTAFAMGAVPWLAWRKTNPDTFMKKLLAPWLIMLLFGFYLIFWVQTAQNDLATARSLQTSQDASALETMNTMSAWISPNVQRMVVVSLASLGLFAALSNSMLAFKVFKAKKPLSAGGWLAHVGMGVLIIGVIVSNTFERTVRINLEGDKTGQAFGYTFQYEGMTGKALPARPINPDYDRNNAVQIRVTPPNGEQAGPNGARTFVITPRWFIWNLDMAGVNTEEDLKPMLWPSITKSLGHDLYVTFADSPAMGLNVVTMKPGEQKQIGPYQFYYADAKVSPGQFMRAVVGIKTADGKAVVAEPGLDIAAGMKPFDMAVPELADAKGTPGAIYLKTMMPGTREATFLVNLPEFPGVWQVPLEVTFKPWINLVWVGVIIAVFGTLMAMVRRALEARKMPSGPTPKGGTRVEAEPEVWEPVTVG